MHAFTKTSNQIRLKKRNASLRSLHHSTRYIRFILKAKAQGARKNIVGVALHSYTRNLLKDGITIRKFLYGQLYNGKLAYRYKLAPTDACPLCELPGLCTYIAGEYKSHNNQLTSRHNAACRLTHDDTRPAFK